MAKRSNSGNLGLVILLLICIGVVIGGLIMAIDGCSRNGDYKLTAYKEENGKVTDLYYDDDYNDFGKGLAGVIMMAVGVFIGAAVISALKNTSSTESTSTNTSSTASSPKRQYNSPRPQQKTRIPLPSTIPDERYKGDLLLSSYQVEKGVNHIGARAFMGTPLTTIGMENVTSFGESAFEDCSALTSVEISQKTKYLSRALFKNCWQLTEAKLPEGLKTINEEAFFGCTQLANVTIPQSVLSIGDSAFCRCSSLDEIHIPAMVTSIGCSAFGGCWNLSSITVDENNENFYAKGNCLIDKSTGTLIAGCKSSRIPYSGVVTIGKNAFFSCRWLKALHVPDGVKNIEAEAFSECESLTEVSLPASLIAVHPSAFNNCTKLSSITFGGTKEEWRAIVEDENLGMPIHCSDGIL